jgi:hypothetical protein
MAGLFWIGWIGFLEVHPSVALPSGWLTLVAILQLLAHWAQAISAVV